MDGIALLFQDPVYLVDQTGAMLDMNSQAQALFGGPAPRRADEIFVPASELRSLLSRASGTAAPVLGALSMRTASGERRQFRARAVVVSRAGANLRFAIQLLDRRKDDFSILSRRVAELNREIASRRAVQARLEDALARNTTLFGELQHRVKNHLQMMLGLFSTARREASDPGTQAVISELELKLRAICEAQQLMYMQDDPSGIAANGLLNAVSKAFQVLAGKQVSIVVEADSIRIPNDTAFPLALIVNELLSNALKHGAAGTSPCIGASLRKVNGGLELMVKDNGPGFSMAEPERHSSGLGLVRGLCRQLGGQLDISSNAGAEVRVRFSLPD